MPLAPHITDHATLRFLERAYGLDVASVHAEMSRGLEVAVAFGARVVICHGVRLIFDASGSCVVTALPKRRR